VERTLLEQRLRGAGCVFAEEEAGLLLEAGGDLEELVARRCSGEPLEQLLGWVEFGGLRLRARPGVFVPRRRTELMARQVVALRPAVLVELCCGAAAVTAVAEAALPDAVSWAIDIDPAAVACAAENIRGTAVVGDLDTGVPVHLRGRVDVIACNAPYVPTAELPHLPPEARSHEPQAALDGGVDGLDVVRRAAACAPSWLRPGGALLVETSAAQAPAAAAAFVAVGLRPQVVHEEPATVVIGLSTGDPSASATEMGRS
jgi:release factor glutamine methyltransferase